MTTYQWNFCVHQAHFCHSPFVSEPEISVGWVSEMSEEVFFMTRNKKNKSSRCHSKWDTRVWDDGALESPLPPLGMTQHFRLSPTKRTFITTKQNRRLEAVNYLRVDTRADIYGGELPDRRGTFAQMVAILGQHSNKNAKRASPSVSAFWAVSGWMQTLIKRRGGGGKSV